MSASNFIQAEVFMRTLAGRCVGGEIGVALALQVASVMRHRYNLNESDWLKYAKPWNEAGGSPFATEDLQDIYRNAPPPHQIQAQAQAGPGPALAF